MTTTSPFRAAFCRPIRWGLLALLAVSWPGAVAAAISGQLTSAAMDLRFEDGYLTAWSNKRTGDSLNFGVENFDTKSVAGQPYAPGVWWGDRIRPADFSQAKVEWSMQLSKVDDDTAVLTQEASSSNAIQAVQWGLKIPLNQVKAIHCPHGVALPAVAAESSIEFLFTMPNPDFGKRPGVLSFHGWRERFYVIETAHGGLLIYVDDPAFEHRPALEFKISDGALFISNRSIMNPPWQSHYRGCKWIIRQFDGPVGRGVQAYQDYLVKAQGIKPLKDRPTGWVQQLAFTNTKPGLNQPLGYPNRPNLPNYSDHWQDSIAFRVEWLKQVAKVLNPSQVMFYDTGWNYGGLDFDYPDHSIDPMFAFTVGPARRMGFHYMLHFNSHFFFAPSIGLKRYITHGWEVQGEKDEPGVIFDALQNRRLENDHEPNAAQKNNGIDHAMVRYMFNPSYEPFRYVLAAMILSSVRSTGADMIHLDVPAIPIELHNERYGTNIAQGLAALFKLIRETLDENGLNYVAIATEITPSEPIMKYVDLSQSARDNNSVAVLHGNPADELQELQVGEAVQRVKISKETLKKEINGFDPKAFRDYFARLNALGEPSVDAMVRAGYVQGYPHLGIIGPDSVGRKGPNGEVHELAAQALALWVTLTAQTLIHDKLQFPAFMDDPALAPGPWLKFEHDKLSRTSHRNEGKLFTSFNYGKLALVRFWQDLSPHPVPPGQWERGDLARFELKDHRVLVCTRQGPTTMRIAIDGKTVVAELDLLNGWQNAAWLLSRYAPEMLRSQIDSVDLSADKVGTLLK